MAMQFVQNDPLMTLTLLMHASSCMMTNEFVMMIQSLEHRNEYECMNYLF